MVAQQPYHTPVVLTWQNQPPNPVPSHPDQGVTPCQGLPPCPITGQQGWALLGPCGEVAHGSPVPAASPWAVSTKARGSPHSPSGPGHPPGECFYYLKKKYTKYHEHARATDPASGAKGEGTQQHLLLLTMLPWGHLTHGTPLSWVQPFASSRPSPRLQPTCATTPAPPLGSGHLGLWDSPLPPAAFWPWLLPPGQTEPGSGSQVAGVLLEPAISHKANRTVSWVKIPQHKVRVGWGDGDKDKGARLRCACSLGSGMENLSLACSSQEGQAGCLRGTSVWLLIWPRVPACSGSENSGHALQVQPQQC